MNPIQLDLEANYQSAVNVVYDTIRDCGSYGCNEDGICRCSRIGDITVTDICSFDMARILLEGDPSASKDKLTQYLVERLVKLAMKPGMFMALTCSGYYGEEIESVQVDKNTPEYSEFMGVLEAFNRLKTDTQRVQMILTLEYKILLPDIAKIKQWEVRSIPLSKIHVDSGVLSRVSKKIVKDYVTYPPAHGVMGVVVPKGADGYRLVDGFHRYSAWTKSPPKPGSAQKVPKTRRKITVLAPK